jgi:hypothetical protein
MNPSHPAHNPSLYQQSYPGWIYNYVTELNTHNFIVLKIWQLNISDIIIHIFKEPIYLLHEMLSVHLKKNDELEGTTESDPWCHCSQLLWLAKGIQILIFCLINEIHCDCLVSDLRAEWELWIVLNKTGGRIFPCITSLQVFLDYKEFWRWCITFRIAGFFNFVHYLVF